MDVEEGRVRGIRPDADHPVTRGRLCPKARFLLDRHRSEARLLTPLVRSGGELLTSSWEAALDLVADKLLVARKRHGSLAVLHYSDSGSMGLLKELWSRLFNLFGGATEPHGSLCWAAGLAAQEADFGRVLSHSPDDLSRAGAVIVWGRNPADTNPHLMPELHAATRRGAPVVVVDPARTATVNELGARHVPVRPGTDAVLALALAGELLRRGAYDRVFCDERAAGFEAFSAAAATVDPESAAGFCGIGKNELLGLADLLARGGAGAGPVAFLLGYGLQRHALGGEAVRAVDALAALAGSVGRPGGGANYANRHALGLLRSLSAQEAARARRYFDRPAFGRQVADLAAPTGAEPPVTVLVCDRANPVAQLPNTRAVVDAFRRIPFKVVADLRSTDTTALADVVLPVADFLEDEDLFFCAWHTHFTWGVPAVCPPDGVRTEAGTVGELAGRLGLTPGFDRSPAEWIAYALGPLVARHPEMAPGGDPAALRGRSFANPAAALVPWASGSFATPSGRFEFGRDWTCLKELNVAPRTSAGSQGTVSGVGVRMHGPSGPPRFHLITPQNRYALHSQFYEEALRRSSPKSSPPGLPAVFVNPRAADALGLAGGQTVRVSTDGGSLLASVVLDSGQRNDTVLIYSGGAIGLVGGQTPASANVLTPDRLTDIGVQAAYYDCLCTLAPA